MLRRRPFQVLVDDPLLVMLGLVVGVALLYTGSRLRSRSLRRPRGPEAPRREPPDQTGPD